MVYSSQRSKDHKGYIVKSNRRALAGIELYAIFDVALSSG